jgi:hypothetical protein
MELKYKLGICFWKIFPWICVFMGLAFIINFIWLLCSGLDYIDKVGLKVIFERIWEGV